MVYADGVRGSIDHSIKSDKIYCHCQSLLTNILLMFWMSAEFYQLHLIVATINWLIVLTQVLKSCLSYSMVNEILIHIKHVNSKNFLKVVIYLLILVKIIKYKPSIWKFICKSFVMHCIFLHPVFPTWSDLINLFHCHHNLAHRIELG